MSLKATVLLGLLSLSGGKPAEYRCYSRDVSRNVSRTIVLYTDHTYGEWLWTHSSGMHRTRGTWREEGRALYMQPRRDRLCEVKNLFKPRKSGFFMKRWLRRRKIDCAACYAEQRFRISGDTLKAYSAEDSIRWGAYCQPTSNLLRQHR